MSRRRRRRFAVSLMPKVAVALAAALGVAACETPRAVPIEADGAADNLEILAPLPGFTPARLPAGWIFDGAGETAREGITVADKAGVPALKVVSGKREFVLVRRTRAVLLATPYLSWAWNVEAHGAGLHPITLVIGFLGSAQGSQPLTWLGKALPAHDRIVAIAWGDSALSRGSLMPAAADKPGRRLYVARGGRENSGSWWLETVDLSRIYSRAWPGDDIGRARVAFIGLAAAGGPTPGAAHISGIKLSR
jgi:hypothetical protein